MYASMRFSSTRICATLPGSIVALTLLAGIGLVMIGMAMAGVAGLVSVAMAGEKVIHD